LSLHARDQANERQIELAWITRTLRNPTTMEADPEDPSLTHALFRIPVRNAHVPRVVDKHEVKPWRVVTVFFDRRLRHRL